MSDKTNQIILHQAINLSSILWLESSLDKESYGSHLSIKGRVGSLIRLDKCPTLSEYDQGESKS